MNRVVYVGGHMGGKVDTWKQAIMVPVAPNLRLHYPEHGVDETYVRSVGDDGTVYYTYDPNFVHDEPGIDLVAGVAELEQELDIAWE